MSRVGSWGGRPVSDVPADWLPALRREQRALALDLDLTRTRAEREQLQAAADRLARWDRDTAAVAAAMQRQRDSRLRRADRALRGLVYR